MVPNDLAPRRLELTGLSVGSPIAVVAAAATKVRVEVFEVDAGQGLRAPVQHLRNLTPEDYERAVEALAGDARALSFLAGFATDAVVNDKGFIARTRFDFSSGQQKLVEEFRNLAELLDPGARRPRQSFDERAACALFGGAYETQHTLGWDPATLMAHAHQRAAKVAPHGWLRPGE